MSKKIWVVRKWKKDGTENFMEVDAAAKNLMQFFPAKRGETEADKHGRLLTRLLTGEELHSPLATFNLR